MDKMQSVESHNLKIKVFENILTFTTLKKIQLKYHLSN